MIGSDLIGPAVVAAAVSGIVTTIGFFINRSTTLATHKEKLAADQSLAERRFEFDKALARERFLYEKQQAVFRRKFELAEAWLGEVYRFREIMEFVRNGVAHTGEGEQRSQDAGDSEATKRLKDIYFVPIERIQRQNEFLASLMTKQHACQALFGDEAKESFDNCDKAIRHVRAASITLIGMVQSDGHFADKALGEKLLADIWSGYARATKIEDSILVMINRAVTVAEALCRPVLQQDKGEPA